MTAKNRLRQLRQPDYPLPRTNTERNITGRQQTAVFCDIDGVRPRATESRSATGIQWVSMSVSNRRKYGRDHRQGFLKRLLNRDDAPCCPKDFEELTTGSDSSLSGKMGVLMIDGNLFGSLQEKATQNGADALSEWDEFIQSARRSFLEWLTKQSASDPAWICDTKINEQSEQALRLETLVWGGDEQVWVVPAWKALELLDEFFRQTAKSPAWCYRGKPVTHSAGLVLCSHKTPIRDAVQLCSRLVDTVKHQQDSGRSFDGFAYQVLESFDHLGEDFDASRDLALPPRITSADTVLRSAQLVHLRKVRSEFDSLPATRRHQILQALFSGKTNRLNAQFARLEKIGLSADVSFPDLCSRAEEWRGLLADANTNRDSFGISANESVLAFWYHLFELWNYLAE